MTEAETTIEPTPVSTREAVTGVMNKWKGTSASPFEPTAHHGGFRKRFAASIAVPLLVLSGCAGGNPTPKPESTPSPAITSSATPGETSTASPTTKPEVSASAETQAELDKAVKDWLDGTTKLPEPLTIGTDNLPFHIGQVSTYVENVSHDTNGLCSDNVVLLGEQVIDNHLVIYGGIQNDDNVRHVLIFNLGKMQENLMIQTFASNNLKDASTHGFVQLPDAVVEFAKYNGRAIQIDVSIGTIDSNILQQLNYDTEINSGIPTSAAVAQWQADTAWAGSKEANPPANVDIDKVLTSFDITRLSQSKNIILPAA